MDKKTLTEISADNFYLIEQRLGDCKGDFTAFFGALRGEYLKDDLSKIYSVLLQKSTDLGFLKCLVREIDTLRHPDNLDDLLDFLFAKDTHAISGEDLNNFVDIRVLCLKVISNYKENRTIESILYFLNSKNEHYKFRLAAAEALGKIGDRNAVEPLIEVVSDEDEKSVYVRESAAHALGMIGDMRAVDPFVSILEAKKSFLDKFTFLKERVVEALSKIDFFADKRTIAALKGTLYDDNEAVGRNAVWTLYNLLGDEILEEILNDPDMPEHCKDEAGNILNDEDEDEADEQ